jgi:hypothetical protein
VRAEHERSHVNIPAGDVLHGRVRSLAKRQRRARIAVGYSSSNASPIRKLFLSRLDEMVGASKER